MIKKVLILSLLLLFIMPVIAIDTPKPAFFKSNRPSLIFDFTNDYSQFSQKYPLSVGVMYFRDCRVMPFYHKFNSFTGEKIKKALLPDSWLEDHFFQEDIIEGLSTSFFREIKASRLFKEVKLIEEQVTFPLKPEICRELANKHDVDMILAVDLNAFTMLRGMTEEEMRSIRKNNNSLFNTKGMGISINFDAVAQLIYLKGNYVVWADTIKRTNLKYADDGALENEELSELVKKTVQQSAMDMIILIYYNGKNMKVR